MSFLDPLQWPGLPQYYTQLVVVSKIKGTLSYILYHRFITGFQDCIQPMRPYLDHTDFIFRHYQVQHKTGNVCPDTR